MEPQMYWVITLVVSAVNYITIKDCSCNGTVHFSALLLVALCSVPLEPGIVAAAGASLVLQRPKSSTA